jgi:hypothetical protein
MYKIMRQFYLKIRHISISDSQWIKNGSPVGVLQTPVVEWYKKYKQIEDYPF